jgi:hypothetical protein
MIEIPFVKKLIEVETLTVRSRRLQGYQFFGHLYSKKSAGRNNAANSAG